MKVNAKFEFDCELRRDEWSGSAAELIGAFRELGVESGTLVLADASDAKRFEFDTATTKTSDYTSPQVAVVLEGGLVQAIVANQRQEIDAEFLVIDYDTDGAEEKDLLAITQPDGSETEAYVHDEGLSSAEIDLRAVAVALDERHKEWLAEMEVRTTNTNQ